MVNNQRVQPLLGHPGVKDVLEFVLTNGFSR
jgi:hypothetical protein